MKTLIKLLPIIALALSLSIEANAQRSGKGNGKANGRDVVETVEVKAETTRRKESARALKHKKTEGVSAKSKQQRELNIMALRSMPNSKAAQKTIEILEKNYLPGTQNPLGSKQIQKLQRSAKVIRQKCGPIVFNCTIKVGANKVTAESYFEKLLEKEGIKLEEFKECKI